MRNVILKMFLRLVDGQMGFLFGFRILLLFDHSVKRLYPFDVGIQAVEGLDDQDYDENNNKGKHKRVIRTTSLIVGHLVFLDKRHVMRIHCEHGVKQGESIGALLLEIL